MPHRNTAERGLPSWLPPAATREALERELMAARAAAPNLPMGDPRWQNNNNAATDYLLRALLGGQNR
jgi:hypothetical protein